MAEDLLRLQLTEHARIAYTSLGSEDRRIVEAWFDHLRNWRNDEFIRSRSKRLKSADDIYTFQTSSDLVIAFKIVDGTVIVLSLFRKEALRSFEVTPEQTTA
jgi:hypothetical protein